MGDGVEFCRDSERATDDDEVPKSSVGDFAVDG